jgi:hypothetical protein
MAIRKEESTGQETAAKFSAGAVQRGSIRVPGYRQLVGAFLRRACRPGHFRRPPSHRRDSLVLDVAVALRLGQADRAYELLTAYDRVLTADPAYLNLLGVIFEIRKNPATSRRFYSLACCVDPHYSPAKQNLRRIYELLTFGTTALAVSLGDAELRAHRTLPVAA